MRIIMIVVVLSCLVCVECVGNTNIVAVTSATSQVTTTNSLTKIVVAGSTTTNFWANFSFGTTYGPEKNSGCDTVTYKALESRDRKVSFGPILQTVYPIGDQTIRDGILFGVFLNKRF